MTFKNFALSFAICILVNSSHPAFAEKLNDQTIQAIYAEADAGVKNERKVRQFIKERFDDNFVLRAFTRFTQKGVVINKTDETKSKTEVLSETAATYEMLDIQEYKHEIVRISYSADGQYAYVHDHSETKGSIKVPAGEGKFKNVPFLQKQTGVDTLTLIGKDVRVLSTDRDSEIQTGDN